jgi:hypothetical protein
VSVETSNPEAYYSLWPITPKPEAQSGIFKPIPFEFKKSYEDDKDKKAEGREADVTVCLYTLNAYGIQKRAKEIASNLKGWCAKGMRKKESCASFTYEILLAGGLNKLAGPRNSTSAFSSMTPSNMREIAFNAKRQELKDASDTAKFKYDAETLPERQPSFLEQIFGLSKK